jgi:uncharacterized protein YbjT (DUF2867 family)
VATDDIAATAANLLLRASWDGQQDLPVVGPDELSPWQMAEVMSEVLERPVAYRQIPPVTFAARMQQFGLSGGFVRGLLDMSRAQDDGIYDSLVPGEPPTPTGPASFRRWCGTVLTPALPAPRE